MRGAVPPRLPMSSCRGILKKTYSWAFFFYHATKYGSHRLASVHLCTVVCGVFEGRRVKRLFCGVTSGNVIGTDEV